MIDEALRANYAGAFEGTFRPGRWPALLIVGVVIAHLYSASRLDEAPATALIQATGANA
jgi:hypothetical protein